MHEFKTRLLSGAEVGFVSLAALKVNDVLQQDEFKLLDDSIVEPARQPLNVAADLIARNLVFDLGEDGYLSSMQLDFQNTTTVKPASLVMDAETTTGYDRVEFNTFSVPLPLQIREFRIGDRNLRQSRKLGLPLDTLNAREAARQVSELIETLVVNGDSTFSFKGNKIEGLTTATNRLTATFGTNGEWAAAAKTGENILADVLTLIKTAEAQNFFGPYVIAIPRDASTKFSEDFKSNSDKSIMQRISEVDGIEKILVADKLATANVVMYQVANGSSIELITGFEPQVVFWPGSRGPFVTNWAVLAGTSVRVHTDGGNSKSPIVHMTV